MSPKAIYVVDEIGVLIQSVSGALAGKLAAIDPAITGVHYLYGHPEDIKSRLVAKGRGESTKFDRYPLVALFMDFAEKTQKDGRITATVQLIIAHHTTKDRFIEDRYIKVFKPILYPIYGELMEALANSPVFSNILNSDAVIKEKIDRPRWGKLKGDNNDGYIFTDVLDAIEVRNLELVLDPVYCTAKTNNILNA